jgi:hypothetical protein
VEEGRRRLGHGRDVNGIVPIGGAGATEDAEEIDELTLGIVAADGEIFLGRTAALD